jgi:hypothetical protein
MYGMRITFFVLSMTMINKRKLQISLLLYLISLVNSSDLIESLKHIVDNAIENDSYDDLLLEQLTQILEEEEGFRIVNQSTRNFNPEIFIDGSGDWIDHEEQPPFYANLSIITFTIVSYVFTLLLLHQSK